MPDVDPRLIEYYEVLYAEGERLGRREGQLELVRTKELLQRVLPSGPCAVLDVGGGTGRYASWLASLGHRVHLVDAVSAHVEAASAIGTFTTEVGDARALAAPDQSFDVVMVMGPLYHLLERDDRLRALSEARRVVRPDGLVVAAFISRSAMPLDGYVKGWVFEPGRISQMETIRVMETAAREGCVRDADRGFPAIGYFHLPSEARAEIAEAGLDLAGLYGVEGPAWVAHDFDERWEREEDRERMLRSARACEDVPELVGLSGHMLAFARRAAAGGS